MLKWILVGGAVVVAALIALVLAVPWLVDTPAMRAYVAQAAAHALGRPVTYASLSVSALPLPRVRLKGLEVGEDPVFGPGPFLVVAEGRIGLRLRPLLAGRVELADLTLDGPRISVVEDASGRLNVATLGAPAPAGGPAPKSPARSSGGAAGAPLLSTVHVVDGVVRYTKVGKEAALQLEKINVTMTQAAPGAPLLFRGDAVGQPGEIRLVVRDGALMPSGARAVGDVPVKATVDLESADIAPVSAVVPGLPAVAGAVKGRIDVGGTLARITATGAVSLDRMTVSEVRPHCGEPARRQLVVESMQLPLIVGPSQIESAPLTARLARGELSLRASVSLDTPQVAVLRDVAIKGMELGPVLVDFLCQPYAVTGPLDFAGEAQLRLADALTSVGGSGRVRVGQGRVVGREIVKLLRDVIGLGAAVATIIRPDRPMASSPLDFDSITATYTINSGVARTDDLLYQARDVKVRAAGTYALADGRVAMEVALSQGANRVKGVVSGVPGSLRVVPTGANIEGAGDVKKFLHRLFR